MIYPHLAEALHPELDLPPPSLCQTGLNNIYIRSDKNTNLIYHSDFQKISLKFDQNYLYSY